MTYLSPGLVAAAKRLRTPCTCSIELLDRCNERCRHCFVPPGQLDNVLDLKVLTDLFAQLADLGVFALTFTGGEIALRPDLFAILAAGRRHHFAVHLLSNGTLWEAADWDEIARLGVSTVRLSLYGSTAKTHDGITRVPGSYDRTMATLDGLLARGVDVGLNTPILATNVSEVAEVMAMAQKQKLSIILDPDIIGQIPGEPTPDHMLAPTNELAELLRDPRFAAHGDTLTAGSFKNPADEARPCAAAELGVFVRCNGDVLPCQVWPEAAGNILTSTFAEIWYTSPVLIAARRIVNGSLAACQACGDRPSCGPCVAMNLRDRGDATAPSPTVCRNTAVQARAAKRLGRPRPGPLKRKTNLDSENP